MKPPFLIPITECTAEQFEEMCRAHDLTYHYSDDHGVWQRGDDEYAIIMKVADHLGSTVANPIWNKIVNTKISRTHAKQFLWGDTDEQG